MKKVQVHRVKHFGGALNVYDVVVNYTNEVEERYPIKNNETITIEITDQDCSLSVWYHPYGDRRYPLCEAFLVKAEDKDKSLIFDRIVKGMVADVFLIEKPLNENQR
jgi:hypothetical protein